MIEEKDLEAVIPPSEYPALWKKVLEYLMAIPRIDIYTCFYHGTLVYAGDGRAVISAPQPFIVQACSADGYKKITAEAFLKCTGLRLEPRVVLKGSYEEAEAEADARKDAEQELHYTLPPPRFAALHKRRAPRDRW